MAIDAALAEVRKSGNLPVPLHIRNAPTSLMKELGYHANYKYAHSSSYPTQSQTPGSGITVTIHLKIAQPNFRLPAGVIPSNYHKTSDQ